MGTGIPLHITMARTRRCASQIFSWTNIRVGQGEIIDRPLASVMQRILTAYTTFLRESRDALAGISLHYCDTVTHGAFPPSEYRYSKGENCFPGYNCIHTHYPYRHPLPDIFTLDTIPYVFPHLHSSLVPSFSITAPSPPPLGTCPPLCEPSRKRTWNRQIITAAVVLSPTTFSARNVVVHRNLRYNPAPWPRRGAPLTQGILSDRQTRGYHQDRLGRKGQRLWKGRKRPIRRNDHPLPRAVRHRRQNHRRHCVGCVLRRCRRNDVHRLRKFPSRNLTRLGNSLLRSRYVGL